MDKMDNDKVVDTLNRLIRTSLDGERGYREAADEVRNDQYKQMFTSYAQERSSFANELQNHVRRLGGKPADSGSTAAAAHRVWIGVRDAVTGKSDRDIVAEVDRGEEVAVNNYQDALNEDLPSEVREVVGRQASEISAAHSEIHTLKDSLS